MNPEIVVIGFPKCGTSALMKVLESDSRTHTLRTSEGRQEIPWPMIQSFDEDPVTDGKIRAHKFVTYIYNKPALEYLTEKNPDSLIVLCIRHPKKALVSWHNMHRSFARSGRSPGHFAYKERDFYADCSLPDYYERFAKSRLNYDQRFNRLLNIVPKHRILVVSQERMSRNIQSVSDHIINRSQGLKDQDSSEIEQESEAHVGYADTRVKSLDRDIGEELDRIQNRLLRRIKESGVDTIR